MESLLLIVTVVSLALGAIMSLVAWRLLRDNRDRSAARIEALQGLARAEEITAQPAPAPRPAPAAEAAWDLALRPVESATAAPTASPSLLFDSEDHIAAPRVPRVTAPAVSERHVSRYVSHHVEPAHDLIATSSLFTSEPARGVPGRRSLALAAVALVIVLGAGAVYAARTWNLFGAIANAAAPRESPPLALLSLRHTTDDSGSFTVTGLVQNPQAGRQLRGVVAVIYLFDQQGQFLASARSTLEVLSFQPGDESPFVVKVPNATGVSRYRVGFRLEDGGVVAHVDRRGQLPDGTMEDAIDPGQGAPPAVAPIAPRRSEG